MYAVADWVPYLFAFAVAFTLITLVLYLGTFLLWLHRHGGAQALAEELRRRLGK